jgi:copper oxidase (laccase) domain-containing protein
MEERTGLGHYVRPENWYALKLGPSFGRCKFQLGPEMYQDFIVHNSHSTAVAQMQPDLAPCTDFVWYSYEEKCFPNNIFNGFLILITLF